MDSLNGTVLADGYPVTWPMSPSDPGRWAFLSSGKCLQGLLFLFGVGTIPSVPRREQGSVRAPCQGLVGRAGWGGTGAPLLRLLCAGVAQVCAAQAWG